eukprot:2466329-Rhodomonas_salina.1
MEDVFLGELHDQPCRVAANDGLEGFEALSACWYCVLTVCCVGFGSFLFSWYKVAYRPRLLALEICSPAHTTPRKKKPSCCDFQFSSTTSVGPTTLGRNRRRKYSLWPDYAPMRIPNDISYLHIVSRPRQRLSHRA